MRLSTLKLKAKDVPVDVFIYIPEENLFFFVDDKDIDGRNTTFYHEPTADPKTWTQITVNNNKMFQVVNNYEITPETLFL